MDPSAEAADHSAKFNGDNLVHIQYRLDKAGRSTDKGEMVLTDTPTAHSYGYDNVGRLAKAYRKVGTRTKTLLLNTTRIQ